ncbi:hypothetical protein PpBr36_03432 [Pyricularia pennisetigena]|uniref:hypothetical protein n=1 Tax=Pyricularia pennisetigena TaxID=1578925 RepID=UPI0011521749|nr:hypothetical protein PpBr36_03432 [Pyricularia pennisetigena]TLS31370.1 hypothetical protein PpBr36_03432 [Pyricularia pennisetigena]
MPTRRPAVAATSHIKPAMRVPVAARVVPPLIVAGCVATVVTYVSRQLSQERGAMDKIFAQKNDEKYEAARSKVFTDFEPRRSLYNILGW